MRNESNNIHVPYLKVDEANVDTSSSMESFSQNIQALETCIG